MPINENIDRYLKIVDWARARYTKNGELLVTKALKIPYRYSYIENLAGVTLLGFVNHFPEYTLHTALPHDERKVLRA